MEVHCWRVGAVLLLLAISDSWALTCDWTGSGLTHSSTDHVTSVSLSCAEGRLEWQYPQGALRVTLDPSSAFDFKGCLRVDAGSRGARVFVETHRKLDLLWSEDDGKDADLWRCFVSRAGSVTFYIEATSRHDDALSRNFVGFDYDLQPSETEKLWDDLEDCRPCTDEEALLNFCTSDFVVRGKVSDVEHRDHQGRTALRVRASRVIRQTNDIFRPPGQLTVGDTAVRELSNHVSERYRPTLSLDDVTVTSDAEPEGHVFVPRHCNAHSGWGDYILMGRHRLAVPMVTCSLSVDDWLRLKRTAEADDTNECVLET